LQQVLGLPIWFLGCLFLTQSQEGKAMRFRCLAASDEV
jgi:hypothetical protein